jgi:hypothetical protein
VSGYVLVGAIAALAGMLVVGPFLAELVMMLVGRRRWRRYIGDTGRVAAADPANPLGSTFDVHRQPPAEPATPGEGA